MPMSSVLLVIVGGLLTDALTDTPTSANRRHRRADDNELDDADVDGMMETLRAASAFIMLRVRMVDRRRGGHTGRALLQSSTGVGGGGGVAACDDADETEIGDCGGRPHRGDTNAANDSDAIGVSIAAVVVVVVVADRNNATADAHVSAGAHVGLSDADVDGPHVAVVVFVDGCRDLRLRIGISNGSGANDRNRIDDLRLVMGIFPLVGWCRRPVMDY